MNKHYKSKDGVYYKPSHQILTCEKDRAELNHSRWQDLKTKGHIIQSFVNNNFFQGQFTPSQQALLSLVLKCFGKWLIDKA